MEINDNHIIKGIGENYIDTPKNKDGFKPNLPDTIIIHYTAGSSGKSSAKYLARPDVKASAHIVIDRSGEIWQLVPFDTKAWHAGKSEFCGRKYYNQYSIGIELDNVGWVEKNGTDFYSPATGQKIDTQDVVLRTHRNEHTNRYWQTYTPQQLSVCKELCQSLISKYSIRSIMGHEEISPGRKTDPGPAFPLDKFREELLLGNRDQEQDENNDLPEGIVTATLLNVRKGPGIEYDKLAQQLHKNQKVTISESRNGWYKIQDNPIGWVFSQYINLVDY